jgi:hypothetical protein
MGNDDGRTDKMWVTITPDDKGILAAREVTLEDAQEFYYTVIRPNGGTRENLARLDKNESHVFCTLDFLQELIWVITKPQQEIIQPPVCSECGGEKGLPKRLVEANWYGRLNVWCTNEFHSNGPALVD